MRVLCYICFTGKTLRLKDENPLGLLQLVLYMKHIIQSIHTKYTIYIYASATTHTCTIDKFRLKVNTVSALLKKCRLYLLEKQIL